jgi:hypothetical protein
MSSADYTAGIIPGKLRMSSISSSSRGILSLILLRHRAAGLDNIWVAFAHNMQTLDYAPPPKATEVAKLFVRFVPTGLAPTALLLAANVHWLATGDPVDGLTAFKAYHYISVVTAVALVAWFGMVCWRAPRRWRTLCCIVALLWVCLNLCWVIVFIWQVKADDPQNYYQTLWDKQ